MERSVPAGVEVLERKFWIDIDCINTHPIVLLTQSRFLDRRGCFDCPMVRFFAGQEVTVR